jgi:GT2 family glycosyltransferase
MADISVLIVGYNSASYLQSCFSHLQRAATGLDVEVLFVNNGNDGSEDLVRSLLPSAFVVPSRGNIGFAAGMNLLAMHASAPLLLLLNPDVELDTDALVELIAAARDNPDYMVLGGLAMRPDGSPESRSLTALPSIVDLVKGAVGRSEEGRQIDMSRKLVDVEAVNGGLMLVRRDTWQKLGGMDESFFLYTEELDLCARVREAGGRLGVVPASRAYHDIGSGNVLSPARIQLMTTGNAHYYHKHFPPARAWFAVACLWTACFTRFAAGLIFGDRIGRFAGFRSAYEKVVTQPWSWWRGYRSRGADPRIRAGVGTGALGS